MVVVCACLNGSRSPEEVPTVPVTPAALAAEAVAAVGAGARLLHVHPRGRDGAESLTAADVGAAVAAVRTAVPGVPVGVTTGAWIEPDPGRRAALVAAWAGLPPAARPDGASVNLSEPGWEAVVAALAEAGVGIEPGVWTLADAARFRGGGLAGLAARILVEPRPDDGNAAVRGGHALLAALGPPPDGVPVLLHGEGGGAWPVLHAAVAAGLDVRIGLEDTLVHADGVPATGNAGLVRDAAARCRGR